MPHPVTADRAAGSLIAMAIGDSLGFLIAGESPRYCADFASHSLAVDDPPWLERDEHAFGQYGADTQLARELGLSIVAARGFTPVLFAARVAALFRGGHALGAGNTTSRAGRRLVGGMVWAQSGEPAPASGNGPAVRAVPVGLTFQRADLRSGTAQMQALVTHHDARAQAAAQLVAEAIFIAATQSGTPGQAFLEAVAQAAEELDPRLAHGARTLTRVLGAAPEAALAHIAALGRNPQDGYPASAVIAGFSTPTVLFALYAFMTAPRSVEDALVLALSAGGDTSSLGALTAALVGAHVGWQGLGKRLQSWSRYLGDRGRFGRDDFIRLAQQLVAH